MKKGICKKGHIINEENGYRRSDGNLGCKICTLERVERRRNNPEIYKKDLERMKQYYKENKDYITQRNKQNWDLNKERYNKQQRDSFPLKLLILKTETLTHYGNGKLACVCCGIDIIQFLTLDHVNGRAEHEKGSHVKRAKYSGRSLWSYLKRNGFPEGYQTLCWNCNSGRQVNKGICPHKQVQTIPVEVTKVTINRL